MKEDNTRRTYDLEELALHLVLPALGFELVRDAEDLLHSARNHACCRIRLFIRQRVRIYAGMCGGKGIPGHPP